jgi:hypothetical protein
MRWVILLSVLLSACTSQFSLGPGQFSNPPIIPGFTPISLGNGNWEEIPTPAAPPNAVDTPIETVLTGLQQAQTTRTLVRQLAR